jgi:ureidoglycolate lyase
MRRIVTQPLERSAFAAFGTVIDPSLAMPEAINGGTTRRYPDLARLDVRGGGGDPVLGIYVAAARGFPLRLKALERHREAAQVFIALGPQRFVVVVAPGDAAPDWERLGAFVTGPGQGVVLRRGCWHHGLVALNDGDRFAVIEGANYRADTELAAAPSAFELAAPPAQPGGT